MNKIDSVDSVHSVEKSSHRWTQIYTLITHYWAEAVVVAIAVLLWAPRLSGSIDLRWDAGTYYVLGTSLATGQGYRILSEDRKSTRLNSSHVSISYAVFCLKKKKKHVIIRC